MPYLLDANAIIVILNDPISKVRKRLHNKSPGEVALSSIVVHELFYGAFKSRRVSENVALLDTLQFPVLEFDREDARTAGWIRAQLAQMGRPIGSYDVLIAGQALARKLILVTHNVGEFSRVPGLLIEDWEA